MLSLNVFKLSHTEARVEVIFFPKRLPMVLYILMASVPEKGLLDETETREHAQRLSRRQQEVLWTAVDRR